jgi:hypothetical protein
MEAQSKLTLTVGDSLAFLESPIRAALVRSRILNALQSLKTRCDSTIVVAHSQGAAACVDALGGTAPAKARERYAEVPVPDTLLTFGAGTNLVVSLDYLRHSPGLIY